MCVLNSEELGRTLPPSLRVCLPCSHRSGRLAAVGELPAECGLKLGETLPLPCISTALLAKTVPFLAARGPNTAFAAWFHRVHDCGTAFHCALLPAPYSRETQKQSHPNYNGHLIALDSDAARNTATGVPPWFLICSARCAAGVVTTSDSLDTTPTDMRLMAGALLALSPRH